MAYDARQIANWFVTRAKRDGESLSIMTLLKLTYIAHGWHLEMRNAAPLFENQIEVWQYGPVIPDVYNSFRQQGIHVSETIHNVLDVELAKEDENLLEQVYNIYGKLSAFQLSELTNMPGGPWDIATKAGGYYAPIPNELIHQHYMLKRAVANKQAKNG
jgi:uncharacterized phage-associated protein